MPRKSIYLVCIETHPDSPNPDPDSPNSVVGSLQSLHLLGMDSRGGLQISSDTYISHHARNVSTADIFTKARRCYERRNS